MKKIKGIYTQGKGNYGFVDIEGETKGYYVFGFNSMNALSGDKVEARIKHFKGKDEAVITKIIERRTDPIVGKINIQSRFGFVVPRDPLFKKDIFIAGKYLKGIKDGELVAVKIVKWEGKNPEGEIVKVLGTSGDRGVDILGYAMESGVRVDFPRLVLRDLDKYSTKINPKELKRRKDFTNLFTITIDGADSKDLDDAISVEQTKKGNYKLYVHIADVTHYVGEKTPVDKEARRRGTSIYLVDKVIPMLPEKLSNGLCSLNPNELKLTLTCEIEVNKAGHIVNTNIYESVIKSDFRMTYKEVDEINNGDLAKGEDLLFGGLITDELIAMLKLSNEFKEVLSKYKKSLGVLEFDFPEAKIELDDNGNPTDFKKYPRYNSNKIIEEFMILANEAISKKFQNIPFLYRVHPEPSEEDISKLRTTLAIFGITLPFKDIRPIDIAKVLNEIKNSAKEKLLSKVVLRGLTKALYSPEPEGHFGLALDYYSHFTSPIRRYPDLQIHRIIKEEINGSLNKTRLSHYDFILESIAKKSSDAEVKAEKLEYKIRDLMAVKFMKDKLGEVFDASVSGVIQNGIFVELENTIEGFVELDKNNYELNEELLEIKNKKTQEKYSIGDKLSVELSKVDEELLRLDFRLV